MRAAVDDGRMATIIAICGVMGHDCYPQDVDFQLQEAMQKIASYRGQQPLPVPWGPAALVSAPTIKN